MTKNPGSHVGETVALVSFSMLFATLLMMSAMYRFSSETWPPMGFERVSWGLPLGSTLVIVLSSVSLGLFPKKGGLVGAIFLGALFMGMQVLLWRHLRAQGIFAEEGIFQSLLYGLTWIHAGHVALGWVALFFLFSKRGRPFIAKFWHFLTVVWVCLFVGVFVA